MIPGFLQLVRFLRGYARRTRFVRAKMGLIVLASVISGITSTALIAVINATLHREESSLRLLGWTFVALCVVLPLSRFLSNFWLIRLTQTTIVDLRLFLCRRILGAPLRRLEELGPSKLMAALINDISSVTAALTNLPRQVMYLTVVLGCLVYLGWLSWALLLVVLGFVAVGVVSYQFPVIRGNQHFAKSRDEQDVMLKHLEAVTQGTKELKIHRHRRQEFLGKYLETTADAIRRFNIKGQTIYAAGNSWGQILFFILIGLVVYVMPSFGVVDAEVLTGYALGILYIVTPLDVLMNTLPSLSNAAISINKLERLGLLLSDEQEETAIEVQSPPEWRTLELAGVTHSYYHEEEEDFFTLGPVDLVFKAGQLNFIVGGNGSGKTTLAKLLIGLYTPEEGEIRVDGLPIDADTVEAYRQQFSVVFTDFYLFENLIGLDPSGNGLDKRARKYLTQLHLDKKVKVEGGALSTLDLSQGQRKRLALLTSYLEDRPIYFFDEWAADQDPQFKEIFYNVLLQELKGRGKTVFVISHDDRYYGVADRLIKLADGKVVTDHRPEGAARAEPLQVSGV